MSIAIVPCLLVPVVTAGRDEFVEDGRKILLQSPLEFDCSNRSRAADVENIHGTRLYPGRSHDRSDLISKVVHVSMTLGID